jgi:hypothetical protein
LSATVVKSITLLRYATAGTPPMTAAASAADIDPAALAVAAAICMTPPSAIDRGAVALLTVPPPDVWGKVTHPLGPRTHPPCPPEF